MNLIDITWGYFLQQFKHISSLIRRCIKSLLRAVLNIGVSGKKQEKMSRARKNCLLRENGVRESRSWSTSGAYSLCKFDDMTAELVRGGGGGGCASSEETRCGCPSASAGPSFRHRHLPPHTSHPHGHELPAPPPRSRCARTRNRWQSLKRVLHRFGDLLIVSIWLLSAVRVPTAMSAPLGSMDTSRFTSKPKWINPCGGEPNAELYTSDVPESRSTDGTETGKPFESILLAARLAKDTAENFKEKYVQQTFNVGFTKWHDDWKSKHYDWLPSMTEIPKSLGEPTPRDHLEKLELDSSLKDIFKYLQMYAVGLEQVTWDQEDIKGDFWPSFKDAEHALKATLCEVQALMVERNVRQHPDVQRDLMDSSVRQNNSTSHRNLRDWLIYRDYMNGLEYVIEVLEHFERQYSSS